MKTHSEGAAIMAAKTEDFQGAVKSDNGMLYRGVTCHAIVEKCDGCERTGEFEGQRYCRSYPLPETKWAIVVCNFATHVRAAADTQGKIKVNPLKASKRGARGH